MMNPIVCMTVALLAFLLAGACVQQETTPGIPVTEPVPPATRGEEQPSPEVPTTTSVSLPSGPVTAQFVPGGEYYAGDRIRLSGTTILSPGNQLLIEVSPLAFVPTNKTESGAVSGVSAVVTVQQGAVNSVNTWEYIFDTKGFAPGRYEILLSGIQVPSFYRSEYFTLKACTG